MAHTARSVSFQFRPSIADVPFLHTLTLLSFDKVNIVSISYLLSAVPPEHLESIGLHRNSALQRFNCCSFVNKRSLYFILQYTKGLESTYNRI